MKSKKKSLAIALLIIYPILAISFSSPISFPGIKTLNKVLSPVILWTGLWQSWNMFQSARTYNAYVVAEIKFKNSSSVFWYVPRMDQLPYSERYRKERYRKWALDNLLESKSNADKYAASLYAARLHYKAPEQIPTHVYLTACSAPIAEPNQPERKPISWNGQRLWKCVHLYHLGVEQKDLI